MAPVTRSSRLTLVALSLLAARTLATPSLPPSTDLFEVLGDEGLFDFETSVDYDLAAPEPADYDLLPPEQQDDIFARVVDGSLAARSWHGYEAHSKRALGKAMTGASTMVTAGQTGVAAMQVTLVDDNHIVIYDKAEDNALKSKSGGSAWGSVYTISTQKVRALNLKTNSFCAGGGWIGNGTLVSVGGNPRQDSNENAADGLAAVRLFTPCTDDKCDVYENPSRIRMTSQRWYPSTVRLQDGSIMILGGMIAGGFNNAPSTDNPTFEWFPPKFDGLPVYSKFLHDALNSNLFPITYLLPNGQIFVAANQIAMVYDWKKNIERRLPDFPNGVTVTYPASAASVLLPLTIANNWTPEILFCGGTTANLNLNPAKLSSSYLASKQCSRMALNTAGIKKGWITEDMPSPRLMGDALLLPTGHVLIINGAMRGIAGYGNVKDAVGASNAASPVKRPVLYDPVAAKGKRFSYNFPEGRVERLYHSTATVIPDGRVFVAGSNPNDRVSQKTYRTRYGVEMLSPPYMSLARPSFSGAPAKVAYNKAFTLTVSVPKGTKAVQAFLMDHGYSTHGVHMSSRMVELVATLKGTKLTVTGPKTTGLFPPGPGWLHINADGVPSVSTKVMVGDGASPPVSQSAINNMLKKTKGSPK
ncbi:uncharacterized protein JCM10292_002262 [Rhodotorula paludigena]|uniref:uncharacterized protein n=1 Tax=Rhodotorula paludigena TaxID=86838 RepID=UPI0031726C5C